MAVCVSSDSFLESEDSEKLPGSRWLRKPSLLQYTLSASLHALIIEGGESQKGRKTGLFLVLAKTVKVEYQTPYEHNQLIITARHY